MVLRKRVNMAASSGAALTNQLPFYLPVSNLSWIYHPVIPSRCETWAVPSCADDLQAWIEEMSAYIKSLAPRQLVTIGSEGFFGPDSPLRHYNPGDWAAEQVRCRL